MRSVAGYVLVLSLLGAFGTLCFIGLVRAGRWAQGREDARRAADTFVETFIPENVDVTAQQAEIENAAILAQLEGIADTLREVHDTLRAAGVGR